MRKTFITFLILTMLAVFVGAALSEERMVQLTVPGCAA